MKKIKACVFGLDGATFTLIKPWVKEGNLPNFKKLIEDGSTGVLTSTIMPFSPTAWTSFLTGKNPGKHGVYDFIERALDSYEFSTITSKKRKNKMLWELLNDYGLKVGFINVPMTYPPHEVNGFMVSGLGAPGSDSKYTYPEKLRTELINEIGDYKIEIEKEFHNESEKGERFNELLYITKKRADAMKYLMKKYYCDFFMVVFRGPDWVQHFFWEYMDEKHPRYTEGGAKKYGNVILQYYQHIDRILGDVLESIDENTVMIVMSDHGFGPMHNKVFLNHWLEDLGLLCFKSTPISLLKQWTFKLGITAHSIYNLFSILKMEKLFSIFRTKTKHRILDASFLSFSDIDWSKTKAYCPYFYGQIFINLKGREPKGIVERGREYDELIEYLTAELHNLKDPDDGKPIVDRVLRGKDVYFGEFSNKSPDLMCIMRNWTYQGSSALRIGGSLTGSTIPDWSGGHNTEGIFIAKGKNIKKGANLENLNIIDIVPTILYSLGVPVPLDMDGKILTDIFKESFLNENPAQFEEKSRGGKKEVRERIKELKTLGKI